MSPRTTFLSRLIGLYWVLASLSMVMHKRATVEAVYALVHNPPMLFVLGVFILVAGLAMVIGHNVWSGGALPVMVTVVGWVVTIKGLLLLFLSPEAQTGLLAGVHYEQFFYLYYVISFVFGAYLTYGGFRSAAR